MLRRRAVLRRTRRRSVSDEATFAANRSSGISDARATRLASPWSICASRGWPGSTAWLQSRGRRRNVARGGRARGPRRARRSRRARRPGRRCGGDRPWRARRLVGTRDAGHGPRRPRWRRADALRNSALPRGSVLRWHVHKVTPTAREGASARAVGAIAVALVLAAAAPGAQRSRDCRHRLHDGHHLTPSHGRHVAAGERPAVVSATGWDDEQDCRARLLLRDEEPSRAVRDLVSLPRWTTSEWSAARANARPRGNAPVPGCRKARGAAGVSGATRRVFVRAEGRPPRGGVNSPAPPSRRTSLLAAGIRIAQSMKLGPWRRPMPPPAHAALALASSRSAGGGQACCRSVARPRCGERPR